MRQSDLSRVTQPVSGMGLRALLVLISLFLLGLSFHSWPFASYLPLIVLSSDDTKMMKQTQRRECIKGACKVPSPILKLLSSKHRVVDV